MNDKEKKVYLETRLRNLKKSYARMIQHPEMVEQCIELKADIDYCKKELEQI